MRGTRPTLLVLALVVAVPIAGIALWSISHTLVELSDPCVQWEHLPGEPAWVGPHGACRQVTVHYESKTRAALVAALVPGGLLAAAMLAVVAAALSRRRMMIGAAIGLLAETLAVLSLAPLTLAAGVGLILIAKRLPAGS